MLADDAGNLWVLRSESPANRPTFDIWDATGAQIGVARLPFGVNMMLFQPRVLGNAFYAVIDDDDDVPSVVRARIVR
jgi:hypothetical protein